MTKDQALMYLKAIVEAFGPDDGIELDQKTWANLHTAIKEALAQHDSVQAKPEPEQEPVEWPHKYGCRANAFGKCDMGCTTPPQRKPLSTEEIEQCCYETDNQIADHPQTWKWTEGFARAIEAKLKEKNT